MCGKYYSCGEEWDGYVILGYFVEVWGSERLKN